jgi:HEAT repeat protein
MRGMTAAAIAGAAIVLVIGLLFLRSGGTPEPAAAPLVRAQPQAPAKKMPRSARVEERLNELRSDAQERRQVEAVNPAPNKRELPTLATGSRDMDMAGADDDEDEEDPEEMEELKEILHTNPDPDERIGAVLMLTGEEGPESMRILLETMDDPDPEVRLAVVEALGDRTEELSPGILDSAIRDPDAEVRFEAISILGYMETPEALQMVRASREDPDEDVRALVEGILDFADDDDMPPPGQSGQRATHGQ